MKQLPPNALVASLTALPPEPLCGSTSPDAIAEMQRRDVVLALDVLGPDAVPEQIAEVVVLPVATVIVRLQELRGDFTGYPRSRKPVNPPKDENNPFSQQVSAGQQRFQMRGKAKKKKVGAA